MRLGNRFLTFEKGNN